jgi:hypothetical protein
MNRRIITLITWALCAFSLALTVAGFIFFIANYDTPVKQGWGPRGYQAAIAVTYAIVGLAISARHPRNMVGWLFAGVGVTSAISYFAIEYATYALLTAPGTLPAGAELAWLSNWIWLPAAVPIVAFLPMLFPHGHLPSPRWRPVAWLGIGSIILLTVVWMILPGPLNDFPDLDNPFGIEGETSTLLGLFIAGEVLVVLLSAAVAVDLVRRFRHSGGVERQQLKWFAYATVLLVVFIPAVLLPSVGSLLVIAGLLGIPIATGVAILRYRLYDIDLLINRTLVYGALTATLALIYWGGVAGLQALFRPLFGQGNDLAIVISTLAIAALFLPLRQRIQGFIDRRFYRRKYDAAKTLTAFSRTARDEVELDRLAGRLVAVVEETMQPAHVSLWLSRPERKA